MKRTYTQTLQDLIRETKISGFESRYLGILFGLLGISFPLLLTGINPVGGFMSVIISIALIIYAPLLLASLILYYFSSQNIYGKKLSVTITSLAGLFMVLFIMLISLDYKFQLLSQYQPYTVWGFFIFYFGIGIFIWYNINLMMDNIFKEVS